ncbi:hypothetical protein GCM10009760_37960 [Kitasatospora kazusensis]|uniref:Uncharacterized protein n=1 Tax=Kitasatospora kazusensis TaxID=407974 RepID=A0ABN2ZTL1_9ACTN
MGEWTGLSSCDMAVLCRFRHAVLKRVPTHRHVFCRAAVLPSDATRLSLVEVTRAVLDGSTARDAVPAG